MYYDPFVAWLIKKGAYEMNWIWNDGFYWKENILMKYLKIKSQNPKQRHLLWVYDIAMSIIINLEYRLCLLYVKSNPLGLKK